MAARNALIVSLLALAVVLAVPHAAVVGRASLLAPAVIVSNDTGSLTRINLTITNGTGAVRISGPSIVGSSTMQSADTAVGYATGYLGINESNYDFNYTIHVAGDNVSGPSAGAAMTLLVLSAFSGRPIRSDLSITGTVSPNGSIGPIGGVFDKTGAVSRQGMRMLLVPRVLPSDEQTESYYLAQLQYGIPLVQVGNVPDAAYYALSNTRPVANGTSYDPYTDYRVGSIPNATLACSNQCSPAQFRALLNATFGLVNRSVSDLGSDKRFYNLSREFARSLAQERAIAAKGYLYGAANLAFLNYISLQYFGAHGLSRAAILSKIYGVQSLCTSISPPQLTAENYEYVLSAELRQDWGIYTINNTVSAYNATSIDADTALSEMALAAQANGWCSAAYSVYNSSAAQSGQQPVAYSNGIGSLALARLTRAASSSVGGIYLTTARQAYREGHYGVAILDSDYAYSLAALPHANMTIGQLLNASKALSLNSTYGVWATEFSKESNFYGAEALVVQNSSSAKGYAQEAYSTALLAHEVSNDTRNIHGYLTPANATSSAAGGGGLSKIISYINTLQQIVIVLFALTLASLILNVAVLIILFRRLPPAKGGRRAARQQ